MWVTSSLTAALTPTAIALGNFDGVHRGHGQVVRPIFRMAGIANSVPDRDSLSLTPETRKASKGNIHPTVVTFNPHPREFFSGQSRQLLTPLTEKVEQLEGLGVEQLVLLPFDRELASLSPQEFVEKILVKHLRPVCISVGQDFRFGHGRIGTALDLKAIAAEFGIEVHVTPLATCQEGRISSSAIREALAQGEVEMANRLLGRAYCLQGKVIGGQQLGRTLGFPTANLQLSSDKFLPRYGVYAVTVAIASGESGLTSQQWGVMNIGCRPTVDGVKPSVEVHLLDWSGDLYEKTITVKLEQFLRSEQKFPSLEALKGQISLDCEAARKIKDERRVN